MHQYDTFCFLYQSRKSENNYDLLSRCIKPSKPVAVNIIQLLAYLSIKLCVKFLSVTNCEQFTETSTEITMCVAKTAQIHYMYNY